MNDRDQVPPAADDPAALTELLLGGVAVRPGPTADGRYHINGFLGKGAIGVVLRATHPDFQKS